MFVYKVLKMRTMDGEGGGGRHYIIGCPTDTPSVPCCSSGIRVSLDLAVHRAKPSRVLRVILAVQG